MNGDSMPSDWLAPGASMQLNLGSPQSTARKIEVSWRLEGQADVNSAEFNVPGAPEQSYLVLADGQDAGLPVLMMERQSNAERSAASVEIVNVSSRVHKIGIRSTDSRRRVQLEPSVPADVPAARSAQFRATVAATAPPGTLNELVDVVVDGDVAGRFVLRSYVDEVDWGAIRNSSNAVMLSLVAFAGAGGTLAPCNCSSGQTGGLARAVGLLRQRDSRPSAIVQFGEFIGDDPRVRSAKAEVILRSLASAGPRVTVVPGEQELSLGAATLRELARTLDVDVIAGNLVDGISDEPLLPAGALLSLGNLRVAVIGALDPDVIGDAALQRLNMRVLDPAVSVGRARKELPPYDYVVLLIHGNVQRWGNLRARSDRVIALIGSNEVFTGSTPASGVSIADSGFFAVSLSRGGRVATELDAAVSDGAVVRIASRQRVLDDSAPEDTATSRRVEDYRQSLVRVPIAASPAASATYAGSEACGKCHATSYDAWRSSRHAKAVETLHERRSEFDPDCLRCHTLGLDRSGAFFPLAGAPVAVACESCHGAGAMHAASPTTRMPQRIACVNCHTPEASKGFNEALYWEKIAHGK
jgi:hypothetical protein